MSKKSEQIGTLLGTTLIVALVLLVVWEFWLQNLIVGTLLSQETSKSSFDRWEFVLACLTIIGISLILPLKRVKQIMGELKLVEQALRGERTLSKVFFSVDNSIILVVDTANQIMQINQKASAILGYKEEDLLGKDWIQFLVKGKEKDTFRKEFQAFVNDRTKQFTSFSITIQAKNKKEKSVEWQAAPLMDERGQVYGTIISGQDISRQQMLDNQLTEIKNTYEPQLQKLSKELNENKKKYHNEAIKTAHAKARFRYWFELEKTLIAAPPTEPGNQEEVNRRIKKALEDYGELCGVDHGFIYQFSEDRETMTNTHLWVSDEPMMEPDSDTMSLTKIPWLKERILNKEILHIPHIEDLPDVAQSEKKMFSAQGIQSVILAPLVINGLTTGYIGFETTHEDKSWDNDEISILKIIARLITHTLSPAQNGSTSHSPHQESLDVDLEFADTLGMDPEETSLEQDIEETKANIERDLKQRIAEMEQNRLQLEEQIKNNESLEYKLRVAQKEMESELLVKTQELEKSKISLQSEIESKQKLEEQLIAGSGNLEKQLAEKNELLLKIQSQLDSEIKAKQNLEEQMSTSQETLEKELADKNAELDKLRKDLEEEKKSKEALESQMKDQPKTAHATNLEKQLTKKSQDLQKAQALLDHELEAKKKLEEQYTRDHNLLEKKMLEKEAEIEELNKLIEDAGKITAGNAKDSQPEQAEKEELSPELILELEQIRTDLESKNNELESLQLELDDFKSHAITPEELEEIRVQIEERENEIQNLNSQLEEEKVAKNWAESELNQLQNNLEQQKEDYEVLEASRSLMESELIELKNLESEYENLKSEVENIRQDYESIKNDYQTAQQEKETVEGEFQLIREEIETVQNDYQNIQQDLENLQVSYQDAQQENENLEVASQQLMNDLEDKNTTIHYLEAQAQRIENVDLPIFTMDTKGTILTWNKGAQKLTGYIMEAAQGQPISFLFPKDEEMDMKEDVLNPLKENGSVTLILPLALATDKDTKGLISLSLFTNGENSDEAMGIIADISDDKSADEAMENMKVYYDSIIKKSGLIPVTLSTDYKVAEISPEAEALLGWKTDSVMNKDFFETVMPGGDWKSIAEKASASLNEDATFHFESQTPVNGSEKHAMVWNLIKESKGDDQETPTILAVGQDINDVRLRENSIKEREALLRSMIDTAVDGFITIDESGIINSFNSTSEDIFGYSSSEVEGHNISMLMPEPYRSEHGNYIARYLATGKSNLVNKEPREFIAQHKDGSTFPVEIAVREIYHGYRRLFVGIIHDISKRKQFEINAKENEDKFRKLMESESDSILIVNLSDNRILDANEASEKIFGYKREELEKLEVTDLSTNGNGHLTSQSGALGLGPKTRSQTMHFNRKDGTLFPAQVISSSFIIQNEKLGLHIIRDVSNQIKTDELMRENDKHLQTILNQATQPIYLKDIDGRFTLVNTRFQELFHVTQEKILNKTEHDVFPKDLADTLARSDKQALESGQPVESRDAILHDDGIHTYVTSKYPLRNSAGVLYGVCGVLSDVSTRLRLEEDLTQLQNSVEDRVEERSKELEAHQEKNILKARMQAAGKVMAALAQQINNPVHGIENILEQLSQRVAMEEIHKGLMTVALSECKRVADLADQLEESQIPDLGEPEKVTLHALIDDVIKKQQPDLKTKSIQLDKHYATNISDIQGNASQIAMAVGHLLRNAEEALTEPNGTITLTTEKVKDRVKIHIQDNGCGIPKEFLGRVFDPFFTTKKADKRAGLGLMTVMGVAQAHNGDIDVKSQSGKGSTFTLILPLVP